MKFGRGKALTHVEEKIPVSVKFSKPIYKILIENKVITEEFTGNKYINSLVLKDLQEKGLL